MILNISESVERRTRCYMYRIEHGDTITSISRYADTPPLYPPLPPDKHGYLYKR